MRKILLLVLALAGSMTVGFAATETTVYYAVPSNVVGNYTVRLNVCTRDDGENNRDWITEVMTLTDKTYFGYRIFSSTYTDQYDGVKVMAFQLYDGDNYVSEKLAIDWNWTGVSEYNGKLYVHNVGWKNYEFDTDLLNITYHIQATSTWTPYRAYEYKDDVNTGWPGVEISENPWNSGWYDYTVVYPFDYIIFNDGDQNGGNGHQTGNIAIDQTNDEYWYTYTVNGDYGTTTSVGKPDGWLDDYQRTGLTVGNFGTICLPFAATIEGATVFAIVSKTVDGDDNLTGINLESVDNLEAGKAYIFKATATTLTATTSGDYTAALSGNTMLGNLSASAVTVPQGNYVVGSDNLLHKVTGDGVTCGQYKGYIIPDKITVASARSANFIGIDSEATGIENATIESAQDAIYNLQGQRVMNAQKGLYIINGKKVLR